MKHATARWSVTAGAAVAAACLTLASARAQEPPQPGEQAPGSVDPKLIWPAGLEKLAGKFVYFQVASPGGLWETDPSGETSRQVSINELPPALRDRLTHAELTISGLKLPTEVVASQRLSPSRRGMLRFYTETAEGRLTMRNLPGIGGAEGDEGSFNGPVLFRLDHQSHSNPSVFGVFKQRMDQEMTWGAATLDYADLQADALPPPEKPGAAAPAGAAKPQSPPAAAHDDDAPSVIGNARVLRSGSEVFAYINWSTKGKRPHTYSGSLRLIHADLLKGGEAPAPGPPRSAPLSPRARPDT